MQKKSPAKGGKSTPSPRSVSKTTSPSEPTHTSTPRQSPSTRGRGRGGVKSPRSTVKRALNMDSSTGGTPAQSTSNPMHRPSAISSTSIPKQKPSVTKSASEMNKRKPSKKRFSDGVPKNPSESDSRCQQPPDYSNYLKDLACVMAKSPPKVDKWDKWGDVLVSDIREFPVEIQQEARHHIDTYIMGIHRSLRASTFPPPPPPPAQTQTQDSSSSACHSSSALSCAQTASTSSASNVPELSPQQFHQLQNALYPHPSPGRQPYVPPNLENSPVAAELLKCILGPSAPYATYQGHV